MEDHLEILYSGYGAGADFLWNISDCIKTGESRTDRDIGENERSRGGRASSAPWKKERKI